MKTFARFAVIAAVGLLVIAAAPGRALAGDREWATVGKILTGFVAADIALNHIDRPPADTRVGVGYAYGVPRGHHPRYEPPRPTHWVPGHYETRYERVWVEGYYKIVETPPVYDWVWDGCRYVWTLVRPGCSQRVWVPGCYQTRTVQVWVPGCYVARY